MPIPACANGSARNAAPPAAAEPLTAAELAALLAPLGAFERRPHLAVAVSGGRDSLALALLADAWARRRGGRVTALTVEHGLRPESAAEAARARAWLAARGIAGAVLRWRPARARSQAAAREARYRLLTGWCRRRGVLHLLLAHHREDQAETVVLRQSRGSGPDGLAGMAPVGQRGGVRLLRPLLAVPRARLTATLLAHGQPWLDDPSNRDARYARVRLRLTGAAETSAAGIAAAALHDRARRAEAADRLAAAAVALRPEGFAWLDLTVWQAAPEAARVAVLGRLLRTVGGLAYPVPPAALARAAGLDRGLTLAGCLVLPRDGLALVCREAGRLPGPVALAGNGGRWDRFDIRGPAGPAAMAGALGAAWRLAPAARRLPAPVRPTLPAIFDALGLVAVPQLGFARRAAETGRWRASWRPPVAVGGPGFSVA